MVTAEAILELRRLTSVSSLDALHALSVSQGDTARAVDFLRTARFATKALIVIGSELAARLATGLIHTGMWFQCEQLDREQWHFAVAPAGYARLVALHEDMLCDQAAYALQSSRSFRRSVNVKLPGSPVASDRIRS